MFLLFARRLGVLAVAAVALTGCSISVAGTLPDAHGRAVPVHVHARLTRDDVLAFAPHAAAAAEPAAAGASRPSLIDGIDLTGAMRTAIALPDRLEALRHTIVRCTAILGAVGIVNAGLTGMLLLRGRRDTRSEAAPRRALAPAAGPPLAAAPSAAAADALAAAPDALAAEADALAAAPDACAPALDASPAAPDAAADAANALAAAPDAPVAASDALVAAPDAPAAAANAFAAAPDAIAAAGERAGHAIVAPVAATASRVPAAPSRVTARACACGQSLSERSRSGRCRRCARAARSTRVDAAA